MNIYEVDQIEKEIEIIARENEGEIPEEKLQELVEKQTGSIAQIESLCKYLRHLDLYMETCKSEIDRIKALKEKADNRVESIKKYLTPYIKKHGKTEAGTFALSIRKSEKVVLAEDFNNPMYVKTTVKESVDKIAIKDALKSGIEIPGASLAKNDNLQIK